MSKTDELRVTFFQESEDLLEGLTDGLAELGSGEADAETVNSVFRAVHSIKGGAGAFQLEEVVRFAHRYENVLDALRNESLTVSEPLLDVLTRAADHLTVLVEAARDEIEVDTTASGTLISELCELTGESEEAPVAEPVEFTPMTISLDGIGPPSAESVYSIRFTPDPGLYLSGNETGFLLRDLCALGEANVRCDSASLPGLKELDPAGAYLSWDIELRCEASEQAIREVFDFVDGLCELTISTDDMTLPALPDLAPGPAASGPAPAAAPEEPAVTESLAPQPVTIAAPPATPAAKSRVQPATSTIRVELGRIDRMINLVGELVINQSMLAQGLKRIDIPKDSEIDVGLEELRSLTRQIQDSVMAIRAQPIKALFQRMSRIAREAAGAVDKTLRVVTEGADTEIDKTVIEKLADPLTHMIRNAVDHGLEKSSARGEVDKDPTGTVRLTAAHSAGRVVIEIGDDGAGINRERVRGIAEEKGLIAADALLSPSEVDNLIFLPGFSTADKLSDLSGRGVGMDVVRRSIQSLGGRVTISSQSGKGSTFSIILPLTLAVLDGMVIGIGDQTVVVPISAIVETMRLDAEQVFQLGTANSVVRIRGTYVPIIDVGSMLGYRDPVEKPEACVFLLVETAEGERAALLIDEIHDQRQVVIKGLEENYGCVEGVAAATILGDGRIALILDPTAIVGAAGPDPQASQNSLATAAE